MGTYGDGIGWTAQLPELLRYAAGWHALYWVCYFIAPILFVSVASLDVRRGEHGYWAASMVSTVHAILVTALAFVALWQQPSLLSSADFFESTPLSLLTLRIFVGYVLSDLVPSLYYNVRWPGAIPNLCHHWFTILAWMGMGAGGYSQGLSLVLISCEITTPFVNMRWFFDKSAMKNTVLFKINGLLMLILWFIFRIVGYFSTALRIYAHRQGVLALPALEMFIYLFSYVVGGALMLLWFSKIVNGALKMMMGKKK
mmetsp:Transcript_8390/g.9395  ORF Transcript_8390/g.9395 Transcript_8390/m.9395 type:complete len:256 (+) Transcript_8390:110-877(+)